MGSGEGDKHPGSAPVACEQSGSAASACPRQVPALGAAASFAPSKDKLCQFPTPVLHSIYLSFTFHWGSSKAAWISRREDLEVVAPVSIERGPSPADGCPRPMSCFGGVWGGPVLLKSPRGAETVAGHCPHHQALGPHQCYQAAGKTNKS